MGPTGHVFAAWQSSLAGLLLALSPLPFALRESRAIPASLAVRSDACPDALWRHLLHVGPDGAASLDGHPLSWRRLARELDASFTGDPWRIVYVTGHPAAPAGAVRRALDLAHGAADRVVLVTPRIERGPGRCFAPAPVARSGHCGTSAPGPPRWVQSTPWWRIW
jgi:hypothetical protein